MLRLQCTRFRVSFTNVQACGGATPTTAELPAVPCPTSRDGTTIYPPELVNATGSGKLECTKQVARASAAWATCLEVLYNEVRCNSHRPRSCRARGRTRRPRTRCAAPCCCRGALLTCEAALAIFGGIWKSPGCRSVLPCDHVSLRLRCLCLSRRGLQRALGCRLKSTTRHAATCARLLAMRTPLARRRRICRRTPRRQLRLPAPLLRKHR